MENTEATISYLRLIRSVMIAFMIDETSVTNRIFHAVSAVCFIRIWRQWLHNNKISVKHFMTQNSWEGLELNLILLLKLSLENNAENIFFLNSQVNESFFRLVRTYTGIENMVANCTMKGFVTRVHRIQLKEILMSELSKDGNLKFPKLLAREKRLQKTKENLSRPEIENIVQDAMNFARNQAAEIGMVVEEINLGLFLKPVSKESLTNIEDIDSESDSEDFLGAAEDELNLENLNELSVDELCVEHMLSELYCFGFQLHCRRY